MDLKCSQLAPSAISLGLVIGFIGSQITPDPHSPVPLPSPSTP